MYKWLAKISHFFSKQGPPHYPSSCFIDYKTAMSPVDRTLSGIDKLSANERKYLTQWTARYYSALRQITWMHRAEKGKEIGLWDLAMVAIIHNEAPFLKEWIEYHRLLGVQHFVIYNNFSTDHYHKVLEPYLEAGIIELIEWPVHGHPAPGQLEAYIDAVRRLRGRARWVAFIDIDEFIVPKKWGDLVTFLADYEDYSQVLINWQLFGTSNIHVLPQDALLTEHLTYKFPDDFHHPWNTNHCVKAIVKPECVVDHAHRTTHCFNLKPGYVSVDPRRQPRNDWLNPEIPVEDIQINHYWFRTIDHFYRRRGPQYPAELVESIFKLGHSKQDTSIARFLPELKERISSSRY